MEVSMIADLVAFTHHAPHEVRKALRVRAQYEERRLDAMLAQGIEDPGRRFCVRAVIEREGDSAAVSWKPAENRSEHPAVAMKHAVHSATEKRETCLLYTSDAADERSS